MNDITIVLPEKYSNRMVSTGDGRIRVFGDLTKTITLGCPTDPQDAIKLLDAYDKMVARRKVVAGLVDKDRLIKGSDNDGDDISG